MTGTAVGHALPSYTAGRRSTAPDAETAGVPLRDAVTGEVITRASSDGLDMAAAVEHGRGVGGPASRALTFHQRAGLQWALAGHLKEHRKEFYVLSHRTGVTLFDSRFDVDGGIGVLSAYAAMGERDLPDDTVLPVGEPQRLGRGGTFVGRYLAVSRPGVAVQVNAYDFSVWGMLETLAPALLAGVPAIVKPATPTAYLTEIVVRETIASGLLPEGGRSSRSAGRPVTCSPTSVHRTRSRSPDPPRPGAGCARTRPWSSRPCGSRPRRTRSTARSSARTPARGHPSSTSTWTSWSPR